MRISELARRTGVSVHRLRRYEDAGLIRADRGASGYRRFSEPTVREVVFLAMGRDLGFSLTELAEFLPRYRAGTLRPDELADRFQARIAEVDAVLAAQQALRQRLVDHVAWLQQRQQAIDQSRAAAAQSSRGMRSSRGSGPAVVWPAADSSARNPAARPPRKAP